MASYGLTEFLDEVEADIAWREHEARVLNRLLMDASDDSTRITLRRSLIALLYAHAEGGVRTALTCYVRIINDLRLSIGDCSPHIVASAWEDLFRALSDQSRKHDFFRARLPDNTKLHRFARHADFVAQIRRAEMLTVRIDHEKVVDTESNLDALVLVKILFQLGFSPEAIGNRFEDLQFLRGLRNAIAHGERRTATAEQCAKYQKTVFALLPRLRDLLATAIRQQSFRRPSAA